MNWRLASIAAGLLVACLSTLQADQPLQSVQQALKEQGFYYGEVNGEKNADTTAAIRRYQIRKGLQITGELNSETLKSLGASSTSVASSVSRAPATTPPPAVTARSSPSPAVSSFNAPPAASSGSQSAFISPRYPNRPDTPPVGTGQIFAGTPYERAPAQLQMRVIAQTQALLGRDGYYRGRIDGSYGPGTAAAVQSFQSRAGIFPSGQLDVGTLRALGLAPDQELQSMDPAQLDYEHGWRGNNGFKFEKGKWENKKHHHRLRLFLIHP